MSSTHPSQDRVKPARSTRTALHRRHRVSHLTLRQSRDRHIDTLKRLEAGRGTNRFFAKAMILLTRHWAETPWNGRAELLQTADWLIRVGQRTGIGEHRCAPLI